MADSDSPRTVISEASDLNRRNLPPLRECVLVCLFLSLLFTWMSWGWITAASDTVALRRIHGLADAFLIVWVLNWVATSLLSSPTQIINAPIYHPTPAQLTGSEHFATAQLLFLPIHTLTGNPVLAANLTAMLTYPIAAFFMYLLMRMLSARAVPALIAGLLLALGRPNVPAHLHTLQFLPLFFPLTAITVSRLRDAPSARRAFLLLAAYLAGLLSSYYVAMLLTIFTAVWILLELLRPASGKRRFLLFSAGAISMSLLIFTALSWPYLNRPEITVANANPIRTKLVTDLRNLISNLDWTSILATSLGVFSLAHKRLRIYAIGSLTFITLGWLLMVGVIQALNEMALPGPIDEFIAFISRFFRIIYRGALLTNFGLALAIALGMETITRKWPLVGRISGLALLAGLALSRGPTLTPPILEPVPAFTKHRAIYEQVRQVTSASPGGSLLELSYRQTGGGIADAKAMMGQIIHQVPLALGHTGYHPESHKAVEIILRGPLNLAAMQSLINITDLRWILVHPIEAWAPTTRQRHLRIVQLTRSSVIVARHVIGDFRLFEVAAPKSRLSAEAPAKPPQP